MVAKNSKSKRSKKRKGKLISKKTTPKKTTPKKTISKIESSNKKIKRDKVSKTGKKGLHNMHPVFQDVEFWNSKLIPLALILLTILIVLEIFFHDFAAKWHLQIQILDMLVIGIFVVDLVFIFFHTANWKIFFKNFWLDILAVFPFLFFFRAMGSVFRFLRLSEELFFGQTLLHEGLEVRKATVATRGQRLTRYLRIGIRSIRVVTKSRFFAKFREAERRFFGR